MVLLVLKVCLSCIAVNLAFRVISVTFDPDLCNSCPFSVFLHIPVSTACLVCWEEIMKECVLPQEQCVLSKTPGAPSADAHTDTCVNRQRSCARKQPTVLHCQLIKKFTHNTINRLRARLVPIYAKRSLQPI